MLRREELATYLNRPGMYLDFSGRWRDVREEFPRPLTGLVALSAETFQSLLATVRRLGRAVSAFAEENAALKDALAFSQEKLDRRTDMRPESPSLEGGVGGRLALQKYARNVSHLMDEINEAPVYGLTKGPDAARFILSRRAGSVFEVVFGFEPRSLPEASRRALAEHFLTHDPQARLMAEPSAPGEAARSLFFPLFLRAGIDGVAGELLRRSGEMVTKGNGAAPTE